MGFNSGFKGLIPMTLLQTNTQSDPHTFRYWQYNIVRCFVSFFMLCASGNQ